MGRSAEGNRIRREAQRTSILEGSLRLFVHRGFAATRVADIALEAGISQGLLYHYFPGKDEILLALLEESLPRLDAAARDLLALDLPAARKLRIALDGLLEGILTRAGTGDRHLLVVLASTSDALPLPCRALIDRHGRGPYEAMERLFSEGQAEGSVRPGDPREQALLFWSLVKGLAIHHAVHGASLGTPGSESILPLFLRRGRPCRA